VNTAAIERNCGRLLASLSSPAMLCAVVKADGYGHGAAACARAAIAGGASWLAVADGREACELRDAGVRDVPLIALGALSEVELNEALAAACDVVVWDEEGVRRVEDAGGGRVHVKLDSGMGRLGTRDATTASAAVAAAAGSPDVELAGVMTHFATADERQDGGFLQAQLAVFTEWALAVKAQHPQVLVHAANSAATMRDSDSHFDMVRCGISIYGMDPSVQIRSSTARAGAGAQLVRRRGQELRAGGERRLRKALHRIAADEHRGDTDRLRRRLAARALRQRESADRRGELPAGRNREHGLRHGGPWRQPGGAAAAGRTGDPDRLERRAADHGRGARAAARDDQLRDHMRAHGAGPAQLHRDGRAADGPPVP